MGKTVSVILKGIGGDGSEHELKVNGEGEIGVTIHEHPPIDETLASIPFKQFFTDDGTDRGSNNMIVDGSVTPQEFWIGSNTDNDIYIKYIDIELTDVGMNSWNTFGDLASLTNGLDFIWKNNTTPDVIIDTGIKENKDFKRIATNEFSFVVITGGGADAIFPKIDFQILFGGRWGVRLRKGSNDKLLFRVNDALAGLITFSINGYGREV